MDEVNELFPQVHVVPVINQGNFIERSISNVFISVLYGGGLSIIVLLLFLRNIRSTIIIALAIPISVIATFSLVYFGGYTLNLMTLGGLALGVGMMVDGSVVVLENIFRRHEEEGEDVGVASVEGAGEVGKAIVASTLTTLVVFLPLVFVRGVSGILFKELALVVMFALTCALLVALSLVPMLASKLLKGYEERAARHGPLVKGMLDRSEAMLKDLDTAYRNLLRLALRHRLVTVALAIALLGASLFLVPLIGTEFLPPSDEGEVRVTAEMEVGTRLDLLNRQMLKVEKIVRDAVPEAVASVVRVGSSGWRGGGGSTGRMRLSLTPAGERDRSNTEIAADLRRRLAGAIAGMKIRTRAPQGQFILQRILGGDEGLTVEIRGYELDTLELLARQAADAMADVPGIIDVDITREAGAPQQDIRVDRAKLADLGLTVRDVTEALETALAGSRAGDYRAEGHSYRILVKLKDAERRSLDEILGLTLATESGEAVALRNVVRTESSRGPTVIERKDQQRFVAVTADVVDRDIGSAATEVQAKLNRIVRPTGYDLTVAGNFEEQQESFRDLLLSLGLALLFVYMVLACQYESLRNPIVVMASVPFAAIGVLVTLFVTRTTLNIQSYIGCIMLGGIVVNNAILLVDQASRLTAKGMDPMEAAAEAGRRRLRPILMTTLTTVLALMPLAVGIGEGADAQAPLARAVVGGLAGSALITLVLIPVVFTLFHRMRREPA